MIESRRNGLGRIQRYKRVCEDLKLGVTYLFRGMYYLAVDGKRAITKTNGCLSVVDVGESASGFVVNEIPMSRLLETWGVSSDHLDQLFLSASNSDYLSITRQKERERKEREILGNKS